MADMHSILAKANDDDALTMGSLDDIFTGQDVPIKAVANPVLGLTSTSHHSPKNVPFVPDTAAGDDPILRFEAGEHTYIGNQCMLQFEMGGPVRPMDHKLRLRNKLVLSYGEIVALGGDFYGDPDKPISDHDTDAGFYDAFNSLAAKRESKDEATEILRIMQEEVDAVNRARREGRDPSEEYAKLGDSLSGKWNRATGGGSPFSDNLPPGRYLMLAAVNWDHFGEHAEKSYTFGHRAACKQAVKASEAPTEAERQEGLELAYAMNAFADHFLSDLFSSGHLRPPRKEMLDAVSKYYNKYLRFYFAGFLIRYMHDEDIINGLFVRNTATPSTAWKAFGDKKFWDSVDTENAQRVIQAVQTSIDEIWTAFDTGAIPEEPGALRLTPNLADVRDFAAKVNFAGLWIKTGGAIKCREVLDSLNVHEWTRKWVAPTTLKQLREIGHNSDAPVTDLPPPDENLVVEKGTRANPVEPNWVPGNQVRYAYCFFNEVAGAQNPSTQSPWCDWKKLPLHSGGYMPQLTVPTGPSGVKGRHIYRQFKDQPPERVGTIDNNTDFHFIDEKR